MIHRIEVARKKEFTDPLGDRIARRVKEDLGIEIPFVRTIDIYTCRGDLTSKDLHILAEKLFVDPIIEIYSAGKPLAKNFPFSFLIEVGYKPGVTDSEGKTSCEEAKEILRNVRPKKGKKIDLEIYTSTQYLVNGDITVNEAERIANGLLANVLIERFKIVKHGDWSKDVILDPPIAGIELEPEVSVIDLTTSDEALLDLSKNRLLALNLDEMKTIQKYYSHKADERKEKGLPPNPTDVELEALAQSWSEHCKHKIFKAQIKYIEQESGPTEIIDSVFDTYIKGATREIAKEKDWLVSVFRDNAGVIKFDSDYNLTFKVETHNSPSALDPYGGAITGIVGVNRDSLGTGLGSRLLFNTNVFCFAPPNYKNALLRVRKKYPQRSAHRSELPKGIKRPKRIFEGVRKGVEDGGNKSGIPTVNGTVRFDERYLGQPLVYCGTGGIMPATIDGKPTHEKKIMPGDLIVMVGGRIGKDGIHGATFSSGGLDEESPQSAVQIGDPFTQKVMADMLLEARDQGLYKTIHDNGAGGLSSSVGELATLSGGCELHLERAPLKYEGLDPWEILLSESQERMTLAVPERKIDGFLELARRRDVEASVLGKFTDSSKFHILHDGQTVAYLDLDFLLEGFPQKKLTCRWQPKKHKEPAFDEPADLGKILHEMLSRLNICSKEYVVRQYDHEVQGGSVIKPLVGANNDGPSDGAVIWPLETWERSRAGVVVANGINHNYGDIDTYWMAACAIDEAIRNALAVGASLDHVALLDNFSWSSSDDPNRLAQLVRACRAIYDYSIYFGTPFISGKDSMYNDYQGEIDGEKIKLSCPPTLLISAIGKIKDVRKAVSMDIKNSGDLIYILGETGKELGGSEYYSLMGEKKEGKAFIGNTVPKVKKKEAKALYEALNSAQDLGLIEAAHDCSEGGLGVALAEMAFAGNFGLAIDLKEIPGSEKIKRDDFILFSESPSRLIVEITEENRSEFETLFEEVASSQIGKTVSEEKLVIKGQAGQKIISESLNELKRSWKETLNW